MCIAMSNSVLLFLFSSSFEADSTRKEYEYHPRSLHRNYILDSIPVLRDSYLLRPKLSTVKAIAYIADPNPKP